MCLWAIITIISVKNYLLFVLSLNFFVVPLDSKRSNICIVFFPSIYIVPLNSRGVTEALKTSSLLANDSNAHVQPGNFFSFSDCWEPFIEVGRTLYIGLF